MCTLSVTRLGPPSTPRPLVRIAFNRDERRSRAAALRPTLTSAGPRHALYPIDPRSGGTWLGVNDLGLVAALLNATPTNAPLPPNPPPLSRGLIVPQLLASGAFDDAHALALSLQARSYDRFRLVLLTLERFSVFASDGERVELETSGALDAPGMWTSSGLGDVHVQRPRAAAWHACLADGNLDPPAQDAFHHSRHSGDGALDVLMARADARTVSMSVIELRSDAAAFRYVELDDDLQPAEPAQLSTLPFAPALARAVSA